MSYDYRDEIKGEVMEKITEILGGVIEEDILKDGEIICTHIKYPYDAYDKSDDIEIYFNNENDYNTVQNYINNKDGGYLRNKLVDKDKQYNIMRFNCTYY